MTTTQDSPKTVHILKDDIQSFLKAYARIEKKFDKAGIKAPSFTIGEPYQVNSTVVVDGNEANDYVSTAMIVDVTFDGDINKLRIYGEYTFIGSAEYVNDNGSFLSFSKEEDIRPLIRDPHECDICNIRRERNKVYIMQENTTGNYIQVGGSCMKDVCGIGVIDAIKEFFGFVFEHNKNIEDIISSRGDKHLILRSFIAKCIAYYNEEGWVSRTVSRDRGIRSSVEIILYPSKNDVSYYPEDKDIELADEVIKWGRNFEGYTDFANNLRTVLSGDSVHEKFCGIAGSVVPIYFKSLEKAKVEEVTLPSEFVGSIKDKIVTSGVVFSTGITNSYYGSSKRLSIRDENGNVFVTFYSGNNDAIWDLQAGDEVSFKATIKDHSIYNDVKQTVLTRFNIVK